MLLKVYVELLLGGISSRSLTPAYDSNLKFLREDNDPLLSFS